MNRVRIIVAETELKKELIERYGNPTLSVCLRHKVGDTYLTSFQKATWFDGFINRIRSCWCSLTLPLLFIILLN